MKKVYLIALMAVALGSVAQAQEWYDTMKLKGDMRYRYENIDNKAVPGQDQTRERLRLRLGVYAKANPDVDVGARLTTSGLDSPGNGDPISGNQTEGAGGSKKGVYLDAGYIDYHPNQIKGLDLIGGKMDQPLYRVADNIWDNDYTPEGLALKYKTGDDLSVQVNGAYHWLTENAAASDAKQISAQGLVRYGKDDDNYVLAGATYTYTENLKGTGVIDNQGKNRGFGNSTTKKIAGTVTNLLYASEFNVVEGFFEAGTTAIGNIPSRIFASVTQNGDAQSDDQGYIAGVVFGRAKDPGTFEIGYNYRDLEKNAVLGCLTDSDAGGGGTNYKGHKITAGYAFMKNWLANVSYFIDQKDPNGKNTDYNRLQIDLNAKF